MKFPKVIHLVNTLVFFLILRSVGLPAALAENIHWLANASDIFPHTRAAGPFGSGLYWYNWGAPTANDNIYFHNGLYRPQLSGEFPGSGTEYAPPSTVVFGDMTMRYGTGPVFYPGQDWTVDSVTVVRGDYRFALGGQTLSTGSLNVHDYSQIATAPNHATPDRRSLTVSNGNILADRVSLSVHPSSLAAELHVVEGAQIETERLYLGGFDSSGPLDAESRLLRVSGVGSSMTVNGSPFSECSGGSPCTSYMFSSGTVIVSEGADITSTDSFWLIEEGEIVVSDATLTTRATGAELTSGAMRIRKGTATFTEHAKVTLEDQFLCDGICVIEGGSVFRTSGQWSPSNTSGYIGRNTPGVVTLAGEDTTWTQDGVLSVGWLTTGEMNVLDGGSVDSLRGVIGRKVGGVGHVTVRTDSPNRPTKWSVQESFTVGGTVTAAGGVGDLLVQNTGALVDVGTSFLVRNGSSVAIEDGGVLRVGYLEQELVADELTRLSVRAGSSLTINPGAAIRVGSNDLLPPGIGSEGLIIASDGHLNGDGLITASSVFNAGTVAPGNSPGILTIAGDYTQDANGILEIEIAGILPGEYDVLNVLGSAEIDGTINIRFVDGFVPTLGDSFDFLTASGSIDRSQATFSNDGLPNGYSIMINAASGGVSLEIHAVPEPSSVALLGLAAIATTFFQRRVRSTDSRFHPEADFRSLN